MLWRGLAPAAVGAVIGELRRDGARAVFRALLFNVTSLDPVSFAGAAIALLLVAAIAAAGPAAAAARTDPARALRPNEIPLAPDDRRRIVRRVAHDN